MEHRIANLEKHTEFLYEEIEIKDKEIDEFKKALDYAQDICRRATNDSQVDRLEINELKN